MIRIQEINEPSSACSRANEMLAKLKPKIAMFYNSDAQARTALSQGEVAAMMATPAAAKRVAIPAGAEHSFSGERHTSMWHEQSVRRLRTDAAPIEPRSNSR
jgi:spermidine/putrescine-binding protein